jgi:hypothetical protein
VKPITNTLNFAVLHQLEDLGCGSSPTLTFLLWVGPLFGSADESGYWRKLVKKWLLEILKVIRRVEAEFE